MIRKAPIATRPSGWVLAVLLAVAPAVWAQEAAVTKRATELRAAPGDTGASLAPLPAQTALTRLPERKGAWVQVRTASCATGWLHIFDLAPASGGASTAAPSESGGGVLRGVTGLFARSAAPSTTGTAASGIRGLGAEDLARAQPNPAAVTVMEALRIDEAQARGFAAQAGLEAVAVAALPAPLPPAGAGGASDPSRQ